MKYLITLNALQLKLSRHGNHNVYKVLLNAFACFLVLIVVASCDEKGSVELPAEANEESTAKVYIAYAGGGWRAHSGHSGWTIAALNNGNRTLAEVFANVGAVSSNSGGSWFSTMLFYSNEFREDLEAPDAASSWATTGWLGLQEKHFNDVTFCKAYSGEDFAACVGNYYSSDFTHPLGALHWRKVVHNLVFKDYPISKTLAEAPPGWAANKPLLLAASLLTSQVVMNRNYNQDNNFYQACIEPSTPILKGKHGAYCTNQSKYPMPIVSPVTFSRVPDSSGMDARPFLSAVKAGTSHSHFNLGYTDDTWIASDTVVKRKILQNPLSVDQVLVMDAAATSSAAVGFAASANVSGGLDYSYAAEDEALSFSLANKSVIYSDPGDKGVDELADGMFVRIADGGPVDNSGVAQLVSFLQHNNKDNFQIVAFDNVQEPFQATGSPVMVGIDIANLFGEGICNGHQFCSGFNCGGTCVNVPPLQIFETDSLAHPMNSWTAVKSASDPMQVLVYSEYQVKTVENTNYGITAGSTGTLITFTCIWENADTEPENKGDGKHPFKSTDSDFKAYAEMIKFINASLNAEQGKRLKHLEDAFMLN